MRLKLSFFALLILPCLLPSVSSAQADRKQVTVDSKILARYVGAYRIAPGADFLITLDGTQLNSKLGNQPVAPVFPQSETLFFYKVVDAQLEFTKLDAQGVPGQLILHQGGRDQPANRLSDAEFKQLSDAVAAAEKRIQDQTAAPGSEAAVRRLIEEGRNGKPDYDRMSPGLAEATRQQLPMIQATTQQLGAVVSVTFTGVGPAGADIYAVKFENGSLEYRIFMAPDGKVDGVSASPLP